MDPVCPVSPNDATTASAPTRARKAVQPPAKRTQSEQDQARTAHNHGATFGPVEDHANEGVVQRACPLIAQHRAEAQHAGHGRVEAEYSHRTRKVHDASALSLNHLSAENDNEQSAAGCRQTREINQRLDGNNGDARVHQGFASATVNEEVPFITCPSAALAVQRTVYVPALSLGRVSENVFVGAPL